jgi:hypothetical protein
MEEKEEDQTTMNEAHHDRALRPPRHQKEEKSKKALNNNADGSYNVVAPTMAGEFLGAEGRKTDSKTTAGKPDNEECTNLNNLRHARALRPPRHQQEKKSKNGKDESPVESNEANAKPRGHLVPRHFWKKHKKDSKTTAGNHGNEDCTNSNGSRHAQALRSPRHQKEKKSKNEASTEPRRHLVPRHFWKKRSDTPSSDSNTDGNLRKTNWRRKCGIR